MDALDYVQGLIDRARTAQREYEGYSQQQVDACVKAIGKAVYDKAEYLARLAVDETKMGRYEDKVRKNMGKPTATWYRLKGEKSRGILRYIPEKGLVELASPMGVVGAITPVTNPTMTPVHNAMVALKSGNAIIVSPHPRGKKSGVETVRVMCEALRKLGAPDDLIQIIPNPTMEISGLVMQMTDVCISTGGAGMVKAAYSSGKPAYGVGPGNVQCLIDRDVDLDDAIPKIIQGRVYDNGVLCSCEQSIHFPREWYDDIVSGFVTRGAYHVRGKEVELLRGASFPDGVLNKDFVGSNPVFIAECSGFSVPEDTKLLLVDVESYGEDELLSREKLFPVLSAYAYDDWTEAVSGAKTNLLYEGQGHSSVIHSNTKENIEYAAVRLPVSRITINQTASSSLSGTLTNGLNPTATLGCGSWGNNSISENLWYTHLMNVSRVAYLLDVDVPEDDEIWA